MCIRDSPKVVALYDLKLVFVRFDSPFIQIVFVYVMPVTDIVIENQKKTK